MDFVNRLFKTTHLLVFLLLVSYGHASAASESAGQEEIDQVLEMMKAQGMTPEQIQQTESMLKMMSQAGASQKAARTKKEQQEFEAATAGHGTARVEVQGKQYELKVTKCEVKDSERGVFLIKAQQAPGMEKSELSIHSDAAKGQGSLGFSTRSRKSQHYNAQNPVFDFDGTTLAWQGEVENYPGKAQLTLNLSCGDEAIFYDRPSRPRPVTADNVLTLYLGDESFQFKAARCSLQAYRTGNLMVDFEATATGNFRGRPAIVLLGKSHGVGLEGRGAGPFHDFDLLLGEVSAQQRQLSPLQLKKELEEVVTAYTNKEYALLKQKYSQDDMNALPPDKMIEMLNKSTQEYEKVADKAKAMRYPHATGSGGTITINERKILFRGPALAISEPDNAEEFGELSALPEVFLTCAQ